MGLTEALEALLAVDPDDAGCEQTWRLVDVYVEIVVGGGDPDAVFPGLTSHLATCGPCATDYAGLLHAVRADGRDGAGGPAHW